MLLYTSRGVSGTSHFRIRGLLPLRGMLVSAEEPAVVFGIQPAILKHLLVCSYLLWLLFLVLKQLPLQPLQTQPWGHDQHLQDKPPTHLVHLPPPRWEVR